MRASATDSSKASTATLSSISHYAAVPPIDHKHHLHEFADINDEYLDNEHKRLPVKRTHLRPSHSDASAGLDLDLLNESASSRPNPSTANDVAPSSGAKAVVSEWLDANQKFSHFPHKHEWRNDRRPASSSGTNTSPMSPYSEKEESVRPSRHKKISLQHDDARVTEEDGVRHPITWNTADCTSISSSEWDDDVCEFDRMESLRVRTMLENIERTLFDGRISETVQSAQKSSHNRGPKQGADNMPISNMAPHLLRECQEWTSHFPHFRILGCSLQPPLSPSTLYRDTSSNLRLSPVGGKSHEHVRREETVAIATALSPTSDSESNTPRGGGAASTIVFSPRGGSDGEILCLEGTPMKYHKITLHEEDMADKDHPVPYEEIFVSDGVMEELIAIDRDEESLEKKISIQRRRQGFPPMTPNAALKDNILNILFDGVWRDVCSWLRPSLKESMHRSSRAGGVSENQYSSQRTMDGHNMPSRGRRHFDVTTQPLQGASQADRGSVSHGFREESFVRPFRMASLLTSTINNQNGGGNLVPNHPGDFSLSNFLQISSKTLQQRAVLRGDDIGRDSNEAGTERGGLLEVAMHNSPESARMLNKSYPLNSETTSSYPSRTSNLQQHPSNVQLFLGHHGRHHSSLLLPTSWNNTPAMTNTSRAFPANSQTRLAPLHDNCVTPELHPAPPVQHPLSLSMQNGEGHVLRGRALRQLNQTNLSSAVGHQQHGTRMSIVSTVINNNDFMPPLPEQLQRSGTLPPIIGAPSRGIGHGVGSSGTAVSTSLAQNPARPSTTQTFRSETPYGGRQILTNRVLGIHGQGLGSSVGPTVSSQGSVVATGPGVQLPTHHQQLGLALYHPHKSLLYTQLWEEGHSGVADVSAQEENPSSFFQQQKVAPQPAPLQLRTVAHAPHPHRQSNVGSGTRIQLQHHRTSFPANHVTTHYQSRTNPQVSLHASAAAPPHSTAAITQSQASSTNKDLPFRRIKTLHFVK